MNYDGLDRMANASWTASSGTRSFFAVSYNSQGQRSTLNQASSYTDYSYDGIDRLNSVGQRFAGNAGNVTARLGYNPASQIISESRDNDAFAFNGFFNVNRAYGVNGLNQYTSAGPASFTYDANGNLISDGKTSYIYDAENRLVAASNGASLIYDPNGRLWQTSGGSVGVTQFLYAGDALVGEYDGSGNLLRRYMHGSGVDEPILWDEGNSMNCMGTKVLHADHEGSIIAIADCSGNQQTLNSYDEYGIPAIGNKGRFQYTGQAWIPELGMYYYKARFYSPYLGRFMQTDPIGYKDQINLYAYVANDPVNNEDSTGMCPQCVGAIIGAVTGAGFEYGVQVLGNLAEGKDLGDALTDVDAGSILISAAGGAIAGATGLGTGAVIGKVLKAERAAVRAENAVARAREGIGGTRRAMRMAAQAQRAQRTATSSTSSVRRALAGAAAIEAGKQVAKQVEPKKDDPPTPPEPPRRDDDKLR